jgi:hypothetical protein
MKMNPIFSWKFSVPLRRGHGVNGGVYVTFQSSRPLQSGKLAPGHNGAAGSSHDFLKL